jgi:hypothetical protein
MIASFKTKDIFILISYILIFHITLHLFISYYLCYIAIILYNFMFDDNLEPKMSFD